MNATRTARRGTTQAEPQAESPCDTGDARTKKTSTKQTSTKQTSTKQTSTKQTSTKQKAAKRVGDKASSASPADESPALWRRLVDAVRGGVNELGEAIADSQALRILDQEIRDNDAELHRVRASLAETLAHYKVATDKHAAAAGKLEEYEGYALKALISGEETLAREIAAKIALLEIERDGEAKRVQELGDGVTNLRKVVAQFENTIKRLKQQVDTVRATESVQRAQAAVASRRQESDARVRTALDSLERIKRRQAERAASLGASAVANETDEDEALQAKLRSAGIIREDDRAGLVLSRLQRRRGEKD
jgi:phage shock protein A